MRLGLTAGQGSITVFEDATRGYRAHMEPQQAVIYKHAMQTLAEDLVDQNGGNSAVYAA